jgi:hypothetical protein
MLVRFILSKEKYLLYRDVELDHLPMKGVLYSINFPKDPDPCIRICEATSVSVSIDVSVMTIAAELVHDEPIPRVFVRLVEVGKLN